MKRLYSNQEVIAQLRNDILAGKFNKNDDKESE
jgi:hypothetical protein